MDAKTLELEGITVEQWDNGITVYRVHDLRRSTVDAWFTYAAEADEIGYAAGRHVRSIYDLRKAGWPTPYTISEAIRGANSTIPDIRESVAVLVRDNIGFQMVRITINRLTRKARQSIRLFLHEDDALAWLEERREVLGE